MVKEADLLFTVLVGMPFWGMGNHEPLIVALLLPIITCRYGKGPWTIIGSDLVVVTVRDLERGYKRD